MELELFAECPIRLDESKGKTLSTFVETVVRRRRRGNLLDGWMAKKER